MQEEISEPDDSLTAEQEAIVLTMSSSEIEAIDDALLSNARKNWRKVAMIVGITMGQLKDRRQGLPDVFYSLRVAGLVACGKLESAGNLAYMRFSEVRLPQREKYESERD